MDLAKVELVKVITSKAKEDEENDQVVGRRKHAGESGTFLNEGAIAVRREGGRDLFDEETHSCCKIDGFAEEMGSGVEKRRENE